MNLYPEATADQIATFDEHGWIVVEDAVAEEDLVELEGYLDTLIEKRDKLAYDFAWAEGEAKEDRSFRLLQSSPSLIWPGIVDAPFRKWAVAFGSSLLGATVEFWYDQLFAKPPDISVPTYWHQDEGYWGRNLDDKGITCWIPLQDVDATNGCLHYVDGGHRGGVLEHKRVDGVQSDILYCEPDLSTLVVVPMRRGSAVFHHSKLPHMTTVNGGTTWRKALAQHMQTLDAGGEGGHYPWKIYVNQVTGETIVPPRS